MGGCAYSDSGVKGWTRTLRAQGVGWDLGCELQVMPLVVLSVKGVGVVSSALEVVWVRNNPNIKEDVIMCKRADYGEFVYRKCC